MFPFLAKKLKAAFDRAIQERLSAFEALADARWPTVLLYRAPVNGRGHVFIAVDPLEKYNAYTVELAASSESMFPWDESPRDLNEPMTMPDRASVPRDEETEFSWNVITGTSGIRDDVPDQDDFSDEALMAAVERNARPDPNMPERVDFCVADTLEILENLLPAYLDAARRALGK
jgi:hypothetical protein